MDWGDLVLNSGISVSNITSELVVCEELSKYLTMLMYHRRLDCVTKWMREIDLCGVLLCGINSKPNGRNVNLDGEAILESKFSGG